MQTQSKRSLRPALLGALLALSLPLGAAVQGMDVEYKDGKTVLQGYLATPEGKGPWPGVLICHSWMGHDDYVKRRARQLAEAGYAVFALDMYGKGVYHADPKDASAASGAFKKDRSAMRARARKGYEVLAKAAGVDKKRLAAMGYCFGGTVALELARSGAPLLGVASFHGGLDTPKEMLAKKGKFARHALILHGGDDPWVSHEDIKNFEDEMRGAGVDWQVKIYGGAVHAFTIKEVGNDVASGAAYNEKADLRSWQDFSAFLREILR